jgi:hypothetical protein
VSSKARAYRRKRLHGVLLEVVLVQIELRVVHSQSTLCAVRSSQERLDRDGLHTVVRSVGRMLEIQCCGPVVGEIIGHLARRTRSPLAYIAVHGRVERIATNDMVHMSGRESPRLGCRIQALEGECRAWEAKPSLDSGNEREGCREGLHLEYVDAGGVEREVASRRKAERCNAVSTQSL